MGGEQGFALGGGRMASLFTNGFIGENGSYLARAGLRIYFGQKDKTLIDRNRQDDPQSASDFFSLLGDPCNPNGGSSQDSQRSSGYIRPAPVLVGTGASE